MCTTLCSPMPRKPVGTRAKVALIGVNPLSRFGLQELRKSEMWITLLGQPFTGLTVVEMIARERL